MHALYVGRYGMYYYDKNGNKVYTRTNMKVRHIK